ncbi:hypothetical protein V6N13_035136 [Hibiscus sabdariffa]
MFARCYPTYAGNFKYQVECGPGEQHVVDIKNHSCTCRKWDLNGIPYNHVVSGINLDNGNITSFVNPCYYKDTQLAVYGHYISPIRGVNQWSKIQPMEPILPHVLRRPPGRPNKKRRLEANEAPTTGKRKDSRQQQPPRPKLPIRKKNNPPQQSSAQQQSFAQQQSSSQNQPPSVTTRQGSRQQQPPRPKLPIRKKSNPPQQSSAQQQSFAQQQSLSHNRPPSVTTVRWMMPNSATQESDVSNQATQDPNSVATD